MGRRGGGYLLDAHLSTIAERFGTEVSYTLRAPVDPIAGRPTYLIIEIDMAASSDDAWEVLNAVEGDLLSQRDLLREGSRRKDPFSNIVITLKPTIEDWETILTEIERME
jgi:hypothetical protein